MAASLSGAVFSPGETVVKALCPRQTFKTNFSKLPLLALNTYSNMLPDAKHLYSILAKEEFLYYATALLWIRILDIKSKQGRVALSIAEMDILYLVRNEEFDVPEPIYAYLSQIGNVVDRTGTELEIDLPDLPETVVKSFGGYHSGLINEYWHNFYEEVPSLGVAADVVMALQDEDDHPFPDIRVSIPDGSAINENLTGLVTNIGPRKDDIKTRLSGLGIHKCTFPESTPGTRFYLPYMRYVSDVIGSIKTFNILKFSELNKSIRGGECQIILTKPVHKKDMSDRWTEATVEATAAACESKTQFGAAFVFGFQLFKEAGYGETDTERAWRWSCLEERSLGPDDVSTWTLSQGWIDSRNARRDLPSFFCTPRFVGFGRRRQDEEMIAVLRRMILTHR